MIRKITQVKVWKSEDRKEIRIYVNFENEIRAGCYYLTGNRWNTAKSFENMSADELAAAKKIGVYEGKWYTVYQNQIG